METEHWGGAVVFLAAGGAHTMGKTAEGKLWAWGCNSDGQLGVSKRNSPDPANALLPMRVGSGLDFVRCKVRMVACGFAHSMAVTHDGKLWTWGCGGRGRLGHKDDSNRARPELVSAHLVGGEKIRTAACGGQQSAAVTEGGALYTWGCGAPSGLGHGDQDDRWEPHLVVMQGEPPTRVGRFLQHPLATDLALAFAMGTHARLGTNVLRDMLPELVQQMVVASAQEQWPEGRACEMRALVLLLGGEGERMIQSDSVTERREGWL